MNIYATFYYCDDTNAAVMSGKFSFQPFENLEIFSNRSVKGVRKGDFWQEEVKVQGNLYNVIYEDCSPYEGYEKVLGISNKYSETIPSNYNHEFDPNGNIDKFRIRWVGSDIISIEDFDPKLSEIKKLEEKISELQKQLFLLKQV